MTKIKGAEIIMECLRKEGVEVIFGYPGGANLPMYDALQKYPDIRHVLVRHEQARRARGRCLRARQRQGGRLLGDVRARARRTSSPASPTRGWTRCRSSASRARWSRGCSAATASRKPTSPASRSRSRSTTRWCSTSRTSRRRSPRRSTSRRPAGRARCSSTSRATCSSSSCEFDYPEKVDLPGYQPTVDGPPAAGEEGGAAHRRGGEAADPRRPRRRHLARRGGAAGAGREGADPRRSRRCWASAASPARTS